MPKDISKAPSGSRSTRVLLSPLADPHLRASSRKPRQSMPAIGRTSLLSPAPAKKPYAKDDIATAVANKSKPWFCDEKGAAEAFDEWAEESWYSSPARKKKCTVAPHKDTNLNVLEFHEDYPPEAQAYWEHLYGPELDMRVRTENFRDYYDSIKATSKTFEQFWARMRPQRKVSSARLEELRQLRLREWNGERCIYEPPKIALKGDAVSHDDHVDPMTELENLVLVQRLTGLRNTHPCQFAGNDPTKRRTKYPKVKGPQELYDEICKKHSDMVDKVEAFVARAKLEDRNVHLQMCRQVAGYHQLIDLLQQGMAALWAAAEDHILIFVDRRPINVREFHKVYPKLAIVM